jgi:hypothetical protein
MGKHKSTEKRSYIPQQNSHADIKRRLERMKYPMGRVQQSNQTLEEAMGTEEYLEFVERQKNRSK